MVRCARCAHAWRAEAPDTAPAPQPQVSRAEPVVPLPTQSPAGTTQLFANADLSGMRLPAPPRPKRQWSGIAAGWVGLIAVILALVSSSLAFRQPVIAAWPPAGRFYDWVGLGPRNLIGLEIRGLTAARGSDPDGNPILVITGEVANITDRPRPVPKALVILLDAQKQPLKSWDLSIARDELLPGEVTKLETSLAAPPISATSAEVRFPPA